MVALPITLQCIMQSLLPVIDEIMVGQLQETSIAALTASNRIYNIYYYIVLALSGATAIFVTQFWGNNKKDSIPKAFKIPIIIGLAALALYLIVAFLMPQQSVEVFSNDQQVVEIGIVLQKIYALSAIPILLTNLYSTLLRSTYNVKIPMLIGIFSVVINTLLNYVLISGFYFVPKLGVYGAAIATLIARFLEATLLILYVYVKKHNISFNIIKILRSKLDVDFTRAYYKAMIPLLTLNILFILADTSYSAIYGQMGTASLTAASIMFPIQGFSIGLFSGLATATAIILGNQLGCQKYQTAIDYSRQILKITTILTIIISVILGGVSYLYVSFYNVSAEVQFNAQILVIVSAVFLTVRVLNMVMCQGVIQSGGDTKFILILDIIGPWCIGVPLAFLGAIVLHLPIYTVYILISMEEVVRLILGLIKVLKGNWAKNLVSDLSV